MNKEMEFQDVLITSRVVYRHWVPRRWQQWNRWVQQRFLEAYKLTLQMGD
jgi:hypothetical protein